MCLSPTQHHITFKAHGPRNSGNDKKDILQEFHQEDPPESLQGLKVSESHLDQQVKGMDGESKMISYTDCPPKYYNQIFSINNFQNC